MGEKTICVIMSTYNGHKYVREQIDSILSQTAANVHLFVRDDGSKDDTLEILKEYPSVEVLAGANVGAKKSFMEAVMAAPQADFYAFADQDDVWDPDKLEVAVRQISEQMQQADRPVLYTGITRLVDTHLNIIRDKSVETKVLTGDFLNGEYRVAPGCTMVWNDALMRQIRRHMPENYVMHDAWFMYVNQAIGGVLIRDGQPHINYRQHENNVVGGKKGMLTSIKRRIAFHKKNGANHQKNMLCEICETYRDVMPKENIQRCEFVCRYDKSLRDTLALLKDRKFFQGKAMWKIEKYLLVLLRRF